MADLTTEYLGLQLRSPLVASPSPMTGDLESLSRLEDAGIAAVVLPSLFEEEITHDAFEFDRMLSDYGHAEAQLYFPEPKVHDTKVDRHLQLVQAAVEALDIPVIASINGVSPGWWVEYAQLLEQAGVGAIELNVYFLAADLELTAAQVEARHLELVSMVRSQVDVPVAVKVGPYFSAFGHMAQELVDAGAGGLVLFNRFYQPDIDLEALDVEPRLELSHPAEMRLPLRWIGLLSRRIDCSFALTTGVHDWEAVTKAILAGADVAMMASVLLREGPGVVPKIEEALDAWLDQNEYLGVSECRGSVSAPAVEDITAYERANYTEFLRHYTTPFGV